LLGEKGNFDFVITEIGGTVGDIESLPYIESVRQMKWELGKSCIVIHLTLIPYLAAAGELKTKPTQHSVKTLLESGVQPDILVCRTERHLNKALRDKLALFCNVDPESVIESIDSESIYNVPLLMRDEKLDEVVLRKMNMDTSTFHNLDNWEEFLSKLRKPDKHIEIGLVGKYIELKDSYKSITESFIHAGVVNNCKVNLTLIHSESINNNNVFEKLGKLHGILVAPGFGERGVEGKISAIRFARENNVPFFGICLGMQCAVIEFSRNVLGFADAHTTEINSQTSYPVIDLMEEQKNVSGKGGTMRLGAYDCSIKDGSLVGSIYRSASVSERHRHRYEFNNAYLNEMEAMGMKAVGVNPQNNLVEIIELNGHPWFIGVQFHPEYKSTVDKPHPLFVSFINAAIRHKEAV